VRVDEAAIGEVFRENSGRSVAALIRVFGDIDIAEDASRKRSRLRCTGGHDTACRPTLAAGSRPLPATVRSIVSGVRRANGNCSGR
jgi:hypothetical protein